MRHRVFGVATIPGPAADEVLEAYDRDADHFCVNPQADGSPFVALRTLIDGLLDEVPDAQLELAYFYHLQKDHSIRLLAFALLHITDSLVTVELLCKSQLEHHPHNGSQGKIGHDLLGAIYRQFIKPRFSDCLLRLRPASDKLVSYYIRWKQPLFTKEAFELDITDGYLVFGDRCALTDPKLAREVVPDLDHVGNGWSTNLRVKSIDDLQRYLVAATQSCVVMGGRRTRRMHRRRRRNKTTRYSS